MIKNLVIYTIFLVITDLLINLVINLIQGIPGIVIMTSMFISAIYLFILFILVGALVIVIFKNTGFKASLITTSIFVYALIPLFIYFLKSNNKNLLEVYIDMHLQFNLFSLIYLPYILASSICILLFNKLKLCIL
jgi:hypothetical protein